MMLKDDFFKINSCLLTAENELEANIRINPDHKIFKGHFPENPVVPGVVSVQIINEILSHHLKLALMTSSAKSIKYISMIVPNMQPVINYHIKFSETENGEFKVIAIAGFEDTVFVKFNGSFKVSENN